MLLDGQHGVEEALDLVRPMLVLVLADAVGVDADLIDHVGRRVLEVDVVLEHIGVAEDMRHHHFVLQQVVLLHQKGVGRIGVDDQLVDLAQPVVIVVFMR